MFCLGVLGGYVDFFLLQDLVSEDYSAVRFWNGWKDFLDNPIPQTVEGYLEFLEREVEFVGRRIRILLRLRCSNRNLLHQHNNLVHKLRAGRR